MNSLQLKGISSVSHRHLVAARVFVVADAWQGQGQAPLLPRPLQVVERALAPML